MICEELLLLNTFLGEAKIQIKDVRRASPAVMTEMARNLEDGLIKKMRLAPGRRAHNMSSTSLRKKSDLSLVSKVPCATLRALLANLQEILLGTRLSVLFPAVPLAIVAHYSGFGYAWVFGLSLIGLVPLAERLSYLTEQITFYTGPTIGGLLNATCGNATEVIIALLALQHAKTELVKWSLVGSVLSNLLLVLGSSLVCGGLANIHEEQRFDRRLADANSGLLLLGALCLLLPLIVRHAVGPTDAAAALASTLTLSRACSFLMLFAYIAYLVFQLKTNRQLFESQNDDSDRYDDGEPEIGFCGALAWLLGVTVVIALLSDYVVDTIEEAAQSWNLPVSFISVILLPIVGNAAEHSGAIIFAYKNKLDITLGVSLGSATQISMFVVPLSVIAAWIMGVKMDLNFKLLETSSLVAAILITAFTLNDGTSHYLKGCVLVLCYISIGASFFVLGNTPNQSNGINSSTLTTGVGAMAA